MRGSSGADQNAYTPLHGHGLYKADSGRKKPGQREPKTNAIDRTFSRIDTIQFNYSTNRSLSKRNERSTLKKPVFMRVFSVCYCAELTHNYNVLKHPDNSQLYSQLSLKPSANLARYRSAICSGVSELATCLTSLETPGRFQPFS